MSFDAHTNFAYSTISAAPSPASSGTSLTLTSGHGARFPAAPFNAVVWPAGQQPLAVNAEVVRVTTVSVDTLTVTRAQEDSTPRAIVVGDQVAAAITAKTLTDVESALADKLGPATGTPNGSKFLRDDLSWETPAGGGPAIDTDATFAANSDLVVPSQKAVRTSVNRQAALALFPTARFGAGSFMGTRLTGPVTNAPPAISVARAALGMGTIQAGTIQQLGIYVTIALNAGARGDICCYAVDASGLPATLLWTQEVPLDSTGDVVVTGLNLPIPYTGRWAFSLWNRPGNSGSVTVTGADSSGDMSTQTYSGATKSYQLRPSSGVIPPDLSSWPAQGGSGMDVLGGFSTAPMIMARGVSA